MKIEGLTIYEFTNEFQIYGATGLLRRVWKTTDREINKQRLLQAIKEEIKK